MFRAIAKSRYLVPGLLCFVLAFVVGPIGAETGALSVVSAGVMAAVLGVLGMLIIAAGQPPALDMDEVEARMRRAQNDVLEIEAVIADNARELNEGLAEQVVAIEENARSLRSMAISLQAMNDRVDALSSGTEESSSSILQMTATNQEVAENMSNLGASVRETASSIVWPSTKCI